MRLTSREAAPADGKSLLGLESMRFVCAVAVLVWHYQHFYFVAGAPVGFAREAQPCYGLLRLLYEYGNLGVEAFWCLSGFIFFWKYAAPISAGRVSATRFALLRFSRLYPLHLLTLLLVGLLAALHRARHGVDFVYVFNDLKHFGLQLLLASDWGLQDGYSFNGPIWSISVEVLVYALFYALSRAGWTRWWHALGMVAVANSVSALGVWEHPLVRCTAFFYLGGLTHLAHAALGRLQPAQRRGACVLVAAALAAATLLPLDGRVPPRVFVALLTPLCAVLMLVLVQPRSPRVARWIVTLGNTTYASYLLHYPLQLLVATLRSTDALPAAGLPLHSPVMLGGYLALTLGLSVAAYRWVELPAQTWLRVRLERPARTAGALPVSPGASA